MEPKVDVEADIQAIKDLILEFNAVFNSADIDKILSYYPDEIIGFPPNQPATKGKEDIRSSYQELFDNYILEDKYVVKDVKISGDLAVAHVTYAYIATPKSGKDSFESGGNEIMVLKKQADTTWQFIYLIWNDENTTYLDQLE